MIEMIGIKKKFGDKNVLNNITLKIQSNMIYGIVGTNGVGKTTLLKIMAGMMKPTEGQVIVNEKKIDDKNSMSQIGFVPDTTALYEYLTGEEYLYFAASILGFSKKEIEDTIQNLLKDFNLYHSKDQLISTYSNGMKQKIGIAAVMIANPNILLLDEPLTGIDLISSNIVKEYLKEFSKNNTVVLTTHMLELAHHICDKVGIIHQGELVHEFDVNNYTLVQLEEIIKDVYLDGKVIQNL